MYSSTCEGTYEGKCTCNGIVAEKIALQIIILRSCVQIQEVSIELPNVHAFEFNFGKLPRLGLRNEGEVLN